VEYVGRFEQEFTEYMETHRKDVLDMIAAKKELSKEVSAGLDDAINNFMARFKAILPKK